MTFEDFRLANEERSDFIGGPRMESIHLAVATAGEVGEACNIVNKQMRGWRNEEATDEALCKEIADIVTFCDLWASRLGVRLEDILIQKFNEVSDRLDCEIKL